MGILLGVAVQILFLLYKASRPKLAIEVQQVQGTRQHFVRITPDQGVIFPAASYIRNLVNKAGEKQGQSILPVVIDCCHINQTDFTAGKGFQAMLEDFKSRSQMVYWLRPRPEVHHTLSSLVGRDFMVLNNVEDLAIPHEEVSLESPVVVGRHNEALMEDTPPGTPPVYSATPTELTGTPTDISQDHVTVVNVVEVEKETVTEEEKVDVDHVV